MTTAWSQKIAALQNKKEYAELNWEGSFDAYLDIVRGNPHVTRTAYQRVYDMILSYGKTEYIDNKKRLIRYHFFSDEKNGARDAVFGLDVPLMKLVNVFKAAAHGYGPEKRVLLLHGPVGSASRPSCGCSRRASSTTRAPRRRAVHVLVEDRRPDHPVADERGAAAAAAPRCAQKVLALAAPRRCARTQAAAQTSTCPGVRFYLEMLLKRTTAATSSRCSSTSSCAACSSARRTASASARSSRRTRRTRTRPSSPATSTTARSPSTARLSDPRAFNFDGEFCVANRGIIEFVEVLKLDVAFLYDLLGASQEHKIKPKKFAQTDIDEVIIGHTNEPEYKKLQNNEFMEALRDRTIKIDIPYITKLTEEVKIYEKDFNKAAQGARQAHRPAHARDRGDVGVLTRLEEPKKAQPVAAAEAEALQRQDAARLHRGQRQASCARRPARGHGRHLAALHPGQDQQRARARRSLGCINPFMVMNELEKGLKHHSLISDERPRSATASCSAS
jgi:serine protein kinase